MLNWLFDWLNKFLEDNPSEEEKDFWSLFEQNMVRGPYFVPFAKLLEKFELEELFKLCKKLEKQGQVYIDRYGIYTTKKGDAILKRLHPSLPNTISVSGRTTKKILNYGRITKKLPDNGRNTTKLN